MEKKGEKGLEKVFSLAQPIVTFFIRIFEVLKFLLPFLGSQ